MKFITLFISICVLTSCVSDDEGKIIQVEEEILNSVSKAESKKDAKLDILEFTNEEMTNVSYVYVIEDEHSSFVDALRKNKSKEKKYAISITNKTDKNLSIKFKAGILKLLELNLKPDETQTLEGVAIDFFSRLKVEIKEE